MASQIDNLQKEEEPEIIDTTSKLNRNAAQRKPARDLYSYRQEEWYKEGRAEYDALTDEQKKIQREQLKKEFRPDPKPKEGEERVKQTPAQR